MGQALSSLTECLGALGGAGVRYARAPASRRVEGGGGGGGGVSGSGTSSSGGGGVRMRSAPPPLVPDKHAVYDLVDDDEDACPTCLEGYSADNPKIVADCQHAYHLQCIVAWQTRSGSAYCPICAQPMKYREMGAPSKPV